MIQATRSLSEVAGQSFDYVIIGGGTAGLCLATRLSEDANVTVAVLEAGNAYFNDPITRGFAKHFNDPAYDWAFQTVPQRHANNGQSFWNRGKCLGGCSSINFHLWNRPPREDVDAWEELGSPGWNWTRFFEYIKKSERFQVPPKDLAEKYNQHYNPASHGADGPVPIMFPIRISDYDAPFQKTLSALGAAVLQDAACGEATGFFQSTLSLDPSNITRCSSMTAYYMPNAGRSNLFVITGAFATKLQTSKADASDDVVAVGVEFLHSGRTHTVNARKEVLLSAGAIKSPQLLELSGIGDPAILTPLGISVVLDLPGVGRNVQDHIAYRASYEISDDYKSETLDLMRDPKYAAEQYRLYAEQKGLMTLSAASIAFLPLQTVSPDRAGELVQAAEDLATKAEPGLQAQYRIQLKKLEDENLPNCEIGLHPGFWSLPNLPKPGKRYLTPVVILSHPFSRGTVHINSSDPEKHPDIDPHYLEEELDLELLVEMVKFIRKVMQAAPFEGIVVKELNPGVELQTDEQLRDMIRKHIQTVWHTCGSLSMLPRERGGVVNENLQVWGTKNIRVVDLSVVPLMPSAHSQATAYAIAEQAADIVKTAQRA